MLFFLFLGAILVVVIAGVWRATAVQHGTGCPYCDRHQGCQDHDHEHAADEPKAAAAGGERKT
ncbi:MAG: hypothetical protein JXR77_08580 [Lentisphaeria bacterium]|nr:hypothetical protein [Lentisphaeria bacterium]